MMDVRQCLIALDRFIADADFSLLSQATLLQRYGTIELSL
jgi:hypothetical protein